MNINPIQQKGYFIEHQLSSIFDQIAEGKTIPVYLCLNFLHFEEETNMFVRLYSCLPGEFHTFRGQTNNIGIDICFYICNIAFTALN